MGRINFFIIALAIAILLLGVAIGRLFCASAKTVEVTKDVVHNDIKTVTHTVTAPNGTVDTTTTTVDTTLRVDTDNKTVVSTVKPKINISALVANDFSKGILRPVYGISASKEFIGPLTLGAFGLTNGTVGVSIGLNF